MQRNRCVSANAGQVQATFNQPSASSCWRRPRGGRQPQSAASRGAPSVPVPHGRSVGPAPRRHPRSSPASRGAASLLFLASVAACPPGICGAPTCIKASQQRAVYRAAWFCLLRSMTRHNWSSAVCTHPGLWWSCWERSTQWWAAPWWRWTPPRSAHALPAARARPCARLWRVRGLRRACAWHQLSAHQGSVCAWLPPA